MNANQKTVVITGAGSGIGEHLARQLFQKGANLALVDVRAERIESLAKELLSNNPSETSRQKITTHSADVSDRQAMQALAEAVIADHGAIQLLINNAGVTLWGYFEENDLDNVEWLFNINFFGVVHGCKFFLPHLKTQAEAKIVNISSMFGWAAAASQSIYCASKYAVRGFSEALYTELEDSNVSVMLVHPGGVNTNLMKDSRAASEEFQSFFDQMMQRSKSPADVAAAIIKGIEKEKFRVRTGPEAYITEWIKRISPAHGQKWIGRMLKKSMGV